MQQRNTHVSSVELLAIETTPVLLVPAPGAKRSIIWFKSVVRFNFVTAAYTAGSNIHVFNGNPANSVDQGLIVTAGFMGTGISVIALQPGLLVPTSGLLGSLENQPLNLKAVGAAFLTGDSTLDITTFYGTALIP